MPIIFDEVTAEIVPPAPPPSAASARNEPASSTGLDPQALARELQRLAERAERLRAD